MGHASLDPTTFVSGPQSYRFTLTPGAEVAEFLGKGLTVDPTANVALELDMKLDQDADVYPIGFLFGGDHAIVLNLDGFVNEQAGPTNYGGHRYKTGSFPFGTWKHVSLRVRRSGGFSVELLVDGVEALASEALVNPNNVMTTSTVIVFVGLYYSPPNTTWGANFDNVLVRTF